MSVVASKSQTFRIRQRPSRSCPARQPGPTMFTASFRLPEFLQQLREKSEASQPHRWWASHGGQGEPPRNQSHDP